jgi:hypothetical protein
MKIWFVTIIPKYQNGDTFSNDVCAISTDFDLNSGDETAT